MNTSCPLVVELQSFALGTLASARLDELADHIDACPACQQRLVDLPGGEDSLLRSLRGKSQPMAPPAPSAAVAARPYPGRIEHHEALRERGYELLRVLGQGGMGTVYLARHTHLDRLLAVKVLPAERLGDAQAVARFQREIKAQAGLDHPHIVRATDGGAGAGWHFLAMEHVIGLNAAELVGRLGPLPLAAACEIVRQAALGIDYASRTGLVHRDIKPSNLMVSEEGLVKVLDFGLAALVEPDGAGELTSTGQVMGTLEYMAPEQLADTRSVDHRADLYSLGCTLYKLLTGTGPFSGTRFRHPAQQIQGHTQMPHEPLRLRRSDVPPEVAAVVDRLLVKDPSGRYSSGAEVAAALQPASQGADLAGLVGRAMDRKTELARAADETSRAVDCQPLPPTESVRKPNAKPKPAAARPPVCVAPTPAPIASRSNGPLLGLLLVGLLLFVGLGLTVIYVVAGRILAAVTPPPKPAHVELRPLELPVPSPAPVHEAKGPAKQRKDPPAGERVPQPAGEPRSVPSLSELLPDAKLPSRDPALPPVEHRPVAPVRQPLPAEALVAESQKRIRGTLQQQFAEAQTNAQKRILCEQLLRAAETHAGDATDRCGTIKLALQTAEEAGSPRLAFKALVLLDRYFEIDVTQEQIESLARLRAAENADSEELADSFLRVLSGVLEREDFALAGEIATAALAAARKSQQPESIRSATRWIGETTRLREQSEAAAQARKTLQATPDDPQANLTAGRYAVLVKRNWNDGLPNLVRGDDLAWAKAARRDQGEPKSPNGQLETGDLWWQLGEQEVGLLASQRLRERASLWYARALPQLKGPDAERVRKRLGESPAATTAQGAPSNTPQAPTPETVKPEPLTLPHNAVWLADLKPSKVEGVHGGDQIKRAVSLSGNDHRHGIWAQPTQDQGTARIAFALGGQYTTLQGTCGMTDQTSTFQANDPMTPAAVFEIYADNKLVWTSKPLVGRGATQTFDLKLRNVRNLMLVTRSNTYSYLSQCAWGSLVLGR